CNTSPLISPGNTSLREPHVVNVQFIQPIKQDNPSSTEDSELSSESSDITPGLYEFDDYPIKSLSDLDALKNVIATNETWDDHFYINATSSKICYPKLESRCSPGALQVNISDNKPIITEENSTANKTSNNFIRLFKNVLREHVETNTTNNDTRIGYQNLQDNFVNLVPPVENVTEPIPPPIEPITPPIEPIPPIENVTEPIPPANEPIPPENVTEPIPPANEPIPPIENVTKAVPAFNNSQDCINYGESQGVGNLEIRELCGLPH